MGRFYEPLGSGGVYTHDCIQEPQERKIVPLYFLRGCPMLSSRSVKCTYLMLAATVLMPAALAKDSSPAVPFYVLQAHTVAVMIDPDATVSLLDPHANQTAQKDVEAALSKWGRFETVLNPVDADIVIVLRKGTSKSTDVTAKDPRQNSRPGSYTDGDISIGAHQGSPSPSPTMPQGQHGGYPNIPPGDPLPTHPQTNPGPPGPTPPTRPDTNTNPQVETGTRDDAFSVYLGHTDKPTDREPSWMYVHKNALHSHDVPAVGEFRKAMDEAQKKIDDAGKKQQKP